jgi:hypothetical protein
VWPQVIVVVPPPFDELARLGQARERAGGRRLTLDSQPREEQPFDLSIESGLRCQPQPALAALRKAMTTVNQAAAVHHPGLANRINRDGTPQARDQVEIRPVVAINEPGRVHHPDRPIRAHPDV